MNIIERSGLYSNKTERDGAGNWRVRFEKRPLLAVFTNGVRRIEEAKCERLNADQ